MPRDIDRRRRYNLSADAIVATVQRKEKAGLGFVVWSGHGHAVHMPLSTFKRMIEAAPDHLCELQPPEMEGVDDHMQEVVEDILLPVATLCRQHGKKIIFRNKNIFWNGTSYVPYWRRVLLDSGFEDVFIPALEETNCRTAELSLVHLHALLFPPLCMVNHSLTVLQCRLLFLPPQGVISFFIIVAFIFCAVVVRCRAKTVQGTLLLLCSPPALALMCAIVCDSHFTSSVTFYLAQYVVQPTTHLPLVCLIYLPSHMIATFLHYYFNS